jgi:hypothetical protein
MLVLLGSFHIIRGLAPCSGTRCTSSATRDWPSTSTTRHGAGRI